MSFGPKAWKDAPDNTTPLSAAALIDLETRLAAYTDARTPREVNALPGSPAEGEQVDYWPSGTIGTGVCWRCTWRGVANGGAGAWIANGPPLRDRINTGEATTSTSFSSLSTPGPTLSVSPGVYIVQVGAFCRPNTAGPFSAVMGFTAPGVSASDNDTAQAIATSAGDGAAAVSPPVEVTVSSSGDIAARYRSSSGGSAQFFRRWITAHPVELRP